MSTVIFILALLAVGATSTALAASLRLSHVRDFLLASYLIAWAEIVSVSLLLSPWHAFTRAGLLAGLAAWLLGAAVVWQLRGRPRPLALHVAGLVDALRDPVVAVLALVATLGLAYSAALLLGTAANDFDSLWYHEVRAAYWRQQHAVAYVPFANNSRINVFPPFAEIGIAVTMVLAHSDRFVGLAQFVALPATMLGVFSIGRRIGLRCRPALFGAAVFGTLPVVALQASTALNDLVVASFLVAAVYFAFWSSWSRLWLAALALGLAIGTKGTALLALPVIALVVGVVHPRDRWPRLLLAALAGTALGSVWYVVNRVETGRFLGGRLDTAGHGPVANAPDREHPGGPAFGARFARMIVDSIDPAGSLGRERLLYAAAAGLALVVGALAFGRRKRGLLGICVGAAVLLLVAMAFPWLNDVGSHAEQKLFLELGSRRLAFLGVDRLATPASPGTSWYGPLGLLLFLAALPVVVREVRR